jgi:hypothetical protein
MPAKTFAATMVLAFLLFSGGTPSRHVVPFRAPLVHRSGERASHSAAIPGGWIVPHLRGGCGSGVVELLGAEDAAERLAALRGDEGAGSEAFVALLAGCAKLAEDGDAGALRRDG